MRIKQGLVKVVFGNKIDGVSHFVWYRISRRRLEQLADYLSKQNGFYYAKVYEYQRLGKRKGNVQNQIAYIYWDKHGFLNYKTL